jgi:hypothetical protein
MPVEYLTRPGPSLTAKDDRREQQRCGRVVLRVLCVWWGKLALLPSSCARIDPSSPAKAEMPIWPASHIQPKS